MTVLLRRSIPRCLLLAALLVSVGCFRGSSSKRPPIHPNPNMDSQPKLRAQGESTFFYDGAAMRMPVEGTVARGDLREDTALWAGKGEDDAWVTENPLGPNEAVLARGQERFDIYCAPCHGSRGNGRGVLYTKAQVQCADLRDARLVEMPDGQLFDVVSRGVGLMPSMRSRVPPRDRWAIIAYVRELQIQ